jgi:hypothetical protein
MLRRLQPMQAPCSDRRREHNADVSRGKAARGEPRRPEWKLDAGYQERCGVEGRKAHRRA